MKYFKSLAVASLALAAAVTAGAGMTQAAQTSTGRTNPMDALVTAISQKFNLNKDDVQKLFDEQRTQEEAARNQRMQEELASRLTQAV